MKLLLDSHILIWLLYEPDRITRKIADELGNAISASISVISLWELTLKYTKQKLAYEPTELAEGIEALNLELLPLRSRHVLMLPEVQLGHADPFDHLLIAQTEVERATLLTADRFLLESEYRTLDARS